MTTQKNNRPVIVGMFILLGLAILVVTIFTLGGEKKTFSKSYTLYAVFNDVGGLLKGGNVWFSGVKVGTVKSIDFYGDSQVRVRMSIEQEAQSHIHKNAKAKIGSDGLIGNKIVVIYSGDPSTAVASADDVLQTDNALSTDDIMATLQANNINLLEITSNLKNITKNIDSGKGTLAKLINDPAMANQLSHTMEELQATVANFKTASLSSKTALSDLNEFTGKINTAGNSINDLVEDTLLYSSTKETLSRLVTAADEVASFTAHLKTAGEQLNQTDNIAGVLLNDSSSAASIKVTLQQLESSSKKLDENLEALQHNFLLRGYFRKKGKE